MMFLPPTGFRARSTYPVDIEKAHAAVRHSAAAGRLTEPRVVCSVAARESTALG
jgi:hypothetical protein